MHIQVHLLSQSQPIHYREAINAYTKDGVYCILTSEKMVHKFPLQNIFRIIETYGSA